MHLQFIGRKLKITSNCYLNYWPFTLTQISLLTKQVISSNTFLSINHYESTYHCIRRRNPLNFTSVSRLSGGYHLLPLKRQSLSTCCSSIKVISNSRNLLILCNLISLHLIIFSPRRKKRSVEISFQPSMQKFCWVERIFNNYCPGIRTQISAQHE